MPRNVPIPTTGGRRMNTQYETHTISMFVATKLESLWISEAIKQLIMRSNNCDGLRTMVSRLTLEIA